MNVSRLFKHNPKLWRTLHKAVTICVLASLFAGLIPPPLVRSALPTPLADAVTNLLPEPAVAQAAGGSVTGTVFQDYNADGVRNTTSTAALPAIDNGVGGVTVTAYDADGSQCGQTTSSAISATLGQYTLAHTCIAATVRVEFTGLPIGYQSGPQGTNSGTGVQFVNATASNVNFGVNHPCDYCQNAPTLATTYMVAGNQMTNTGVPALPNTKVVVSFGYNSTTSTGAPTGEATAKQVGTTVGLAYQRSTKTIFVGAYMKRHAGFGPGGPGAIYKVNPGADGVRGNADDVISTFLDLDSPSYFGTGSFGTDPHPTSTENIAQTPYNWFHDNQSLDDVSKMAFGDLDMSEDDQDLYTVNLFDRALYRIPVGNPPVAPAKEAIIKVSVPITVPNTGANALASGSASNQHQTCASADVRPFGLGIYRQAVYVGLVCSAQSTQLTTDLRAYIYSFDPTTNSFGTAPVLEFPLTYTRSGNFTKSWKPYMDTFATLVASTASDGVATFTNYPQPILSDIVFDRGAMILGLRDRAGDQLGKYAGDVGTGAPGNFYYVAASGDMLRACANASSGWTVENDGTCGGVTTTGSSSTNAGPGGGEFYLGDKAPYPGGANHVEASEGTLAQVPGAPEVIMSAIDATGLNSGGFEWLNNTTGALADAYEVYQSTSPSGVPSSPSTSQTPDTTFGKAGGIGDVEALCDPAPIQIGNRIWNDTNSNGIQDPGESPIQNITVELYKAGVRVGQATTNAQGEYYFTSGTSSSDSNTTDNTIHDGGIGIRSGTGTAGDNSDYEIRIPNVTGGSKQAALGANTLTTANAGGVDLRDSDGMIPSGQSYASYVIPHADLASAGYNNHTYDFGFGPQPTTGTIQIIKNTVGDDGTFDFTSTDGQLDGVSIITVGNTGNSGAAFTKNTGVYTISEDALPANWALTSLSCTGDSDSGSVVTLASRQVAIDLDAGENIICTFTNTYTPPPATLQIVKQVMGGVSSGPFTVTVTGPSSYRVITTVIPNAATVINGLSAGIYTVTETTLPDAPSGFTWNSTIYTPTAGIISLTNGATGVVTITNALAPIPPSPATLVIDKIVTGGSSSGPFTMTVTGPSSFNQMVNVASGASATLNNLAAGVYTVTESSVSSAPVGFIWSTATYTPTNGVLTLTAGETGYVTVTNPLLPNVQHFGDRLWLEADTDGDATTNFMAPVPNHLITAIDQNRNVYTTTTDSNGFYTFTVPAATYTVTYGLPPTGYQPSATPGGNAVNAASGGNDTSHGDNTVVTLNAGEIITTVDFGFNPIKVSIGNLVWEDGNDNGLYDVGEDLIDNLTMELWIDLDNDGLPEPLSDDGSTPLSTTVTVNGIYSFTELMPDSYFVRIPAPPPITPLSSIPSDAPDNGVDNDDNGSQLGGPNAQILSPVINLTAGEEPGVGGGGNDDMTVDFGLVDPFIGNLVWNDTNNDGDVDADEPGLANVIVQALYDADNSGVINGSETTPYRQTTTDSNGLYTFGDLVPGGYQIIVPASNFAGGGALALYRYSSDVTDTADNQQDEDDNGTQAGPGLVTTAPLVTLTVDQEPSDSDSETGRGNDLDNGDDNNGDMTIDFGFYGTGTIQIVKQTLDGVDDTFTFNSADADLNGLSLATSGGIASSAVITKLVGIYTLNEILPVGWLLAHISVTGDSDSGSVKDASNAEIAIDLDANEAVIVTFKNVQGTVPSSSGVLTITKGVMGSTNNGPYAITVTGPNSYLTTTAVMSGTPTVLTNLDSGVYTVTETSPGAGWVMTYTVDTVISTLSGVETLLNTNNATLAATPISGRVFRDFNSNGQITANGVITDTGVQNITVTAYDKNGNSVGDATTDANGNYTINPMGDGPYRVEFSDLPSGYEPTTRGGDNGTSTQFVITAGATNVNLGINHSCDYCQDNPNLATTKYVNGDPLLTSAPGGGSVFYPTKDFPAWIQFPYSSGVAGAAVRNDSPPASATEDYITLANAGPVGTLWGLAYQRESKRLFGAAVVRRHAGLGPLGTGGIYMADLSTATPAISNFVNLAAAPFNLDTGAFSNPRGLDIETASLSHDNEAFALVGKAGLGGLALSSDGKNLWLINLKTRTLHKLYINNPAQTPTSASALSTPASQPWLTATCPNGVERPWAVKVYRDKLYVGTVCTAENGGTAANLSAKVYEYDGATFTTVLTLPLNYTKGAAYATVEDPGQWYSWLDTYSDAAFDKSGNSVRTQPILSAIEFDTQTGNMILGFTDRNAMQFGYQNYKPDGSTNVISGFSGGDILLACQSSGAWVLESDGQCPVGSNPSAVGAGNAQGPSGGEFFYDDRQGDAGNPTNLAAGVHKDIHVGALAALPGANDVAMTAMDPFRFATAGVAWLNTTDGSNERRYEVYQSGTSLAQDRGSFAKAAGLGDLELLCDSAPTEIGNRVWNDLNGDGIQDPGEPGLDSVQVSLQGPTGTVTTNTDSNGNYYYTVQPNTDYTITVGTPSGYSLTLVNEDSIDGTSASSNHAISDTRDSDAVMVGGVATIYYTTGNAGQNNHGLDFGFTEPTSGQVDILNTAPNTPKVSLGNRVWYDTNNNGSVDGGEQNVTNGVVVELYQDSDSSGGFSAGDSRVGSTVTSGGYYTFTDLTPSSSAATRYLVVISDTNFLVGGRLVGYVNSSGQYPDNLDANGDNNDHGAPINRLGRTGGVVASSPISLTVTTQPTGEGNEGNDPIQANVDANSNQTIDFGFYQLVLGNRIWEDLNNNGNDDSEPALGSLLVVTVTNQSTGDVYTTTTDASGYYTFTGIVSGTYVVSIDAPADYVSSSTDGSPNAADLDDNGVGSNGGRISSAPFVLTPGVTIVGVQTASNASGSTTNPSVDFGLWQPAALGNYVWLDTTTVDGIQNEAAVNGVNGVTVTLFYSNPVTGLWAQQTVTQTANHPITNHPGYYTFTNLISGTYYVSFTLPSGYRFTTQSGNLNDANNSDANTTTGTTAPITLNAGEQNPNVDAGLLAETLSLGNRVWYDVNNNGRIDSSESGLSGVRVELYRDSDGNGAFTAGVDSFVAFSNTVSGGYYTFTRLSEGGYLVVISDTNFSGVLLNYRSSDPTTADPNDNVDNDDNGGLVAGGVVASGVITLTLGTEPDGNPDVDGDSDANTNWTVDFGFYLADLGDAPASYSTTLSNTTPYTGASHLLSTTLYLGSRVDADEDGQPVTVGTAATNDDDTVSAAAVGGVGDDEDGIVFVNTLIAGQVVTVEVTVNGNGGYLNGWLDFDGDGVWTQAGDQIFDGLAVNNGTTTLTFTVPLTASTNITTYARFRLSTAADLNFYDISTPAPDGEVEDYNVLIQPLAAIGDRVWYDTNYNGLQDGSETGVMSVTVELLDSNGTVISTTATNAGGYYSFTNLTPGLYGIRFVTSTLPAGYIITRRDQGSDNAADSDADPTTGRTVNTLLTSDENDPDWDMGIFQPTPTIEVIKSTNGADADTAPGVTIDVGDPVTWTYAISNTGNVTLTNVTLGDDIEGSVSCPVTELAPHTGMTCVLTGTATAGQYANTAIVTGTPTIGGPLGTVTPVTDTNPSHYTNAPTVLIGDRLWIEDDNDGDATTGNVTPVGAGHVVTATSSSGVIYTDTTDANGIYAITVPANATYTVTTDLPGSVVDTPVHATDGADLGDNDRNHERLSTTVVVTLTDNLSIDFGFFQPQPTIEVIKYTNGDDADTPTGPTVAVGSVVTWTYDITNTGNVTLTNVTLVDDREGGITCPLNELAPSVGMTCILTGTAVAGQYANTAIVTGTPTLGPLTLVTDTNPSHYYGGNPGLVLRKYTNGYDADNVTGPHIAAGDLVTWTYVITNTGNQTLTNLTLVDNVEGTIACPVTTLAAGATITCLWTGTAVSGQYTNTAVVSGTTPSSSVLTFTNPSHYYGVEPSIDLIKYTNGDDADSIPGPTINAGNPVTWTYVVTNTGNVALTNIDLSDDVEGAITCPATTLAVGASMTCTQTGIALDGQYTNTAVVTGTPNIPTNPTPELPGYPTTPTPNTPVTATNPSHYFGQALVLIGDRLWIEDDNDGKATTGNVTPVGAGHVVTATASDGTTVYTGTTDASGIYTITVPANDTYTVTTDLPGGGVVDSPLVPAAGNNENHDRNGTTVVVTTLDNLSIDFGFFLAAQFGDRVWIESDSDGDANSGTITPVEGMVITATNGTNVYTATTNAAGYYSFTVTAGTYTVTYGSVPSSYGTVVPSSTPGGNSESGNAGSYAQTGNPDQSHVNGTTVTLAAGQANWTVDFAFNPPSAQFGDRVWIESDSDGDANSGTITPVEGMVITATNGTNVYTTTTNAAGYYSFTVTAGTYTVTYGSVPASYGNVVASATPGGNSETGNAGSYQQTGNPDQSHVNGTTVTVAAGQANWTVDFAFNPPSAQFGDRVWIESDSDGDANSGTITPVEGMVITATNGTNIYTTTTNAAGYYSFTVAAGTYTVTYGSVPSSYGTVVPSSTPGGNSESGNAGSYAQTGNPDQSHAQDSTVTVTAGQANWHIDFAFNLPLVLIGDRLWIEDDNDGDATTGIVTPVGAGQVVTATASDGTTVYTGTTDANGIYTIRVPANDTYIVTTDLPGGLLDTPVQVSDGSDPIGNNDLNHARLGTTVVLTTTDNLSIDFGFVQPINLGDYVWEDLDRDGQQESGEPGVGGVTVTLTTPTGMVITTTTDLNGVYTFTNLLPRSSYTVTFSTPTGYHLTTPNQGSDSSDSDAPLNGVVVVTTGTTDELTIDAGLVQLASLGDRVWYDIDADGVQDSGETGVEHVAVALLNSSGTVILTTTTNASGLYTFINLLPGTYSVRFTAPVGHVISPQDQGGNNTTDSDVNPTTGETVQTLLTSGENDLTWDMGIYELAAIGDRVWYDDDRDGIQDGGELAVAGVTVELRNRSGTVISTTTTNAGGIYSFTNLAPAEYSIRFVLSTLPANYLVTQQDQGNQTNGGANDSDANPTTGVTVRTTLLAAEYDPSWDMGIYQPPATIGDRVWHDLNANGIQDVNEPGIPGVTVTLYDSNGVVTSTTTAGDGLYLFANLDPGDYRLQFTPPTGYLISPSNQGIDDGTDSDVDGSGATPMTTLVPNEIDRTWDLGLYQPAAIGDRVWVDTDRDGVQDGGELGVAGVTVELLNRSGTVINSTTTNASGIYSFTNLVPSEYSIRFVTSSLPSDYRLTGQDLGDDAVDSDANPTTGATLPTTLTSGEYDPTWDAGIYLPPAAIGDRVWFDNNRNGLQDSGEAGVPNVRVELLNSSNAVVGTMTTNASGYYSFTNLVPGDYSIRFVLNTLPVATVVTTPNAGDDGTDSDADPTTGVTMLTTLLANEVDPTWDMGIYLPPAAIGDRVWLDTNRDGVQDGDELGLPGVTVNLLDGSGNVINTTTTNASGLYTFTNLVSGDYAVQFVSPTGYTPSPQDQGDQTNGGTNDSDADPVTGRTVTTALTPNESDPTWDAGFYAVVNLGNLVWHDPNNNGLVDSGEKGIRNVTVQLFREGADPATATPVATATTDANGNYNFDSLLPGRYFVYIPTPPLAYPWSSTLTDVNDNGEDNDDNGSQSVLGAPVRSPIITLAFNSEPANDGDGANGDLTVDFGFFAPASLGDLVWFDTDKDGVQDQSETGVPGTADERGVPGVLVTLYAGVTNSIVATTTTGTNGRYLFANLLPGDYYVQFTLPAGYSLSPADQGGNDAFDSDANAVTLRTPVTSLTSGEHDPTLDMGLYLPTEPASIGDRVWYDTDRDGAQDNGETGVPGITVTLYRADGSPVATTTTDVNGAYEFNSLPPGDYFVTFTPPAGYIVSPQDAVVDNDEVDSDVNPATGRTVSTTLLAGENDPTWDLGLYLAGQPATIGDLVWLDGDVDGIQDTGETGVPGVLVALYRTDGLLVATTRTNVDGHYQFTNLTPGDYFVEFSPPAGYYGTRPNQGTNELVDSDVEPITGRTAVTTLTAGENDPTWDYGLFLFDERSASILAPAAIGNRVWLDVNQNGVQDSDEQNVPGVTVKLYTSDGQLVVIDITDANGLYGFANLPPGDYYVEVVLPPNYSYSPVSTTPGNDTDSNADPNTGRTPVVTLPSGIDSTWDTGIFLLPTNLGDDDEPAKVRILLPLITR